MCTRAIGLSNDQEIVLTRMRPTEHLDFDTGARVVGVVDANQLSKLFAGSM
jgi:hypothetical protein